MSGLAPCACGATSKADLYFGQAVASNSNYNWRIRASVAWFGSKLGQAETWWQKYFCREYVLGVNEHDFYTQAVHRPRVRAGSGCVRSCSVINRAR
jgi:hypothetical protein